jgi:two-component system sensor histidine kinase ChvG
MSRIALVDADRNILASVSMILEAEGLARAVFPDALTGETGVNPGRDATTGAAILSVATPIRRGDQVMGVVAV